MSPNSRAWLKALLTLLLVWSALIYLLEPAGSSMVAVWDSSATYTHGYVITPIALWLVWRRRREVMALDVHPDAWALLAALVVAATWLAGRIVGAQVVEHYAMVGLLVIAVWALFGRALAWTLLFPLSYLLLMVPAGDSLIDPMIHFTADFTVAAVQLIGIPVLQEGTFLSLPSGDWSVVEACSGIRYFLSSIVLGWLFAYLTYQTWWKRVAFGIAAVIVPVIANGFRAAIIVLLGHFSSMTLAVGVDHLIYGWVWFGIVMMTMFWVGNFWREDHPPHPPSIPLAPSSPPRPAWMVALIMVSMVALFPLYEYRLTTAPPAPSPLGNWRPPANWQISTTPITDWQPRWLGMDDQRAVHLRHATGNLMLFIAWYGAQRQDAELINSQNVLVPEKDPVWRNLFESGETVALGQTEQPVRQALLHAPNSNQRLLVWYWRHIEGQDGINIFRGKLQLAKTKLAGRGDAAAGVLIAAPYQEKPSEAEAVLKAFLNEVRPGLNKVLDSGAARP